MGNELDQVDYKILHHLQEDCSVSIKKLAAKVYLSETPCWRRVQKLEAAGYIKQRVCILDHQTLGCAVTVTVMVTTSGHASTQIDKMRAFVLQSPWVQSCQRVSGDTDYILQVRTQSIAQYDAFYRQLIETVGPESVRSYISMEEMKHTHCVALPGI